LDIDCGQNTDDIMRSVLRVTRCLSSSSTPAAPTSSLAEQLERDMVDAQRNKDSFRLQVVRSLRSRVTYLSKAPNAPKSILDSHVLQIVRNSIADVEKTIEETSKLGERGVQLAQEASREKDILMSYMQKQQQLSDEEVRKIIADIIREAGATSVKVRC
jgi:uncharacterized protein YqeY